MDMNLPAMSPICWVTGERFLEEERVVSHLVTQASDGQIGRYDVREAAEPQFETPGRVACRWTQRFKPRVAHESADREMKLTAENLFLTLADPSNELSVEDGRLVQFLALMLERKRVIKPRGRSDDGTRDVYEHRGTKGRYEVPVGELNPAFFIAVQEQLSVLVGEPADAANPETPPDLTGKPAERDGVEGSP